MADTGFVSEKSLTFDCDLDLGGGNLNFVQHTPSHFALSFCEVQINSLLSIFELSADTICNRQIYIYNRILIYF